jgi:hypothetical protein
MCLFPGAAPCRSLPPCHGPLPLTLPAPPPSLSPSYNPHSRILYERVETGKADDEPRTTSTVCTTAKLPTPFPPGLSLTLPTARLSPTFYNPHSRYDYEGVESEKADAMMAHVRKVIADSPPGTKFGAFELQLAGKRLGLWFSTSTFIAHVCASDSVSEWGVCLLGGSSSSKLT